jgi:hypothetical protein
MFNKTRWIPENSVKIENNDANAVAYIYTRNGRIGAVMYKGNAIKSYFHYAFDSEQTAVDYINAAFNTLINRRNELKERRKQSFTGHSFAPKDIIYTSWGYDQTNVDAYIVTKVTKNFVYLQQIGGKTVETGFMCGHFTPDPSSPFGEITRHKASGDRITMEFGSGREWNGGELSCSWYH